ncbi:DUF4198 domain-containing protein [Stenotrophomonas sp. HITSZ_GD]|uniref:DUF4198 domain-containing protein n=1 Tax=Stenotrophomonas sp. HITSZ_GD TaxID=3037248 RepID=UPI00240E5EA2|nr:DUF4198 domain-containing protein [Stenotrophomonas sp. HITSZ_GD]MDG2525621.1 DUF4198 domain-containing protein [Stenotrophomonas sp. HITSZ_GD]
MKCPLLAAVLAVVAWPAAAHMPYLAPATFQVQAGGTVTLDAAFAEAFFVPEAAFDDSHFSILGPDGRETAPERVVPLHTRVVVEHALPQDAKGTYRFSTGERLGAVFRTWEIDGRKVSSRDANAPVPAGAKVTSHFQSRIRAETYLTVGAPDRGALRPYGHGLELVAVTHPSDLYANEPIEFELQFDGKPLADTAVQLSEAVWSSDRQAREVELRSDAQGRVRWAHPASGIWLALARHRSAAPAGAAAPEYSNSYSLVFHVLNP